MLQPGDGSGEPADAGAPQPAIATPLSTSPSASTKPVNQRYPDTVTP